MEIREIGKRIADLDFDEKKKDAILAIVDIKMDSDMDKVIQKIELTNQKLEQKIELTNQKLESFKWFLGILIAIVGVVMPLLIFFINKLF